MNDFDNAALTRLTKRIESGEFADSEGAAAACKAVVKEKDASTNISLAVLGRPGEYYTVAKRMKKSIQQQGQQLFEAGTYWVAGLPSDSDPSASTVLWIEPDIKPADDEQSAKPAVSPRSTGGKNIAPKPRSIPKPRPSPGPRNSRRLAHEQQRTPAQKVTVSLQHPTFTTIEHPDHVHVASDQNKYVSQSTTTSADSLVRKEQKGFINPYNFVPFFTTQDDQLGEGPPLGHGSWDQDSYSGHLTLRITAHSPLLLKELSSVEGDLAVYSTRRTPDGLPLFHGASLKGVLRSMYEQVTGSRLGVFNADATQTRRTTANEAQDAQPGFVQAHDPERQSLTVRLPGTLKQVGGSFEAPAAVKVPVDALGDVKTGDRVTTWACPCSGKPGKRGTTNKYWKSYGFVKGEEPCGTIAEMPALAQREDGASPVRVSGIVLHSGSKTAAKKKYSLVIVDTVYLHDGRSVAQLSKSQDVILQGKTYEQVTQAWRNVMDSLSGEAPEGLDVANYAEKGSPTHSDYRNLRVHTPLFVFDRGDRGKRFAPAPISRDAFDVTPGNLLPLTSHPAERLVQLNAADRVFGWAQNGRDTGKDEDRGAAYRGHLRFGTIRCTNHVAFPALADSTIKLAALNGPKPAQARFYTRTLEGSPRHDIHSEEGYVNGRTDQGSPRHDIHSEEGYENGIILSGAKVYLHQIVEDDYWDLPQGQLRDGATDRVSKNGAFKNWLAPKGQTDNVSSGITDWVMPGTEFETTLRFSQLRAREVQALVWVCSLPVAHFHRVGGGKPLGFGSARIELVHEESRVLDSDMVSQKYRSLSPVRDIFASSDSSLGNLSAMSEAFDEWLLANAPRTREAVLLAAKGFDKPTHYPRIVEGATNPSKEPDVESYEWFVENNRSSTKKGDKTGRLLGLPELREGGTPLLPFDPTKPVENNDSQKKRSGNKNFRGGKARRGRQGSPRR